MMRHPTAEEFEAWVDHPITRWVMAACRLGAEDAKELWITRSWEGCEANRELLVELRTRADATLALCDATYEDWIAIHEQRS